MISCCSCRRVHVFCGLSAYICTISSLCGPIESRRNHEDFSSCHCPLPRASDRCFRCRTPERSCRDLLQQQSFGSFLAHDEDDGISSTCCGSGADERCSLVRTAHRQRRRGAWERTGAGLGASRCCGHRNPDRGNHSPSLEGLASMSDNGRVRNMFNFHVSFPFHQSWGSLQFSEVKRYAPRAVPPLCLSRVSWWHEHRVEGMKSCWCYCTRKSCMSVY